MDGATLLGGTMTKIRGGRSLLDDLKAIRGGVLRAGHDAIDFAIQPKLIEDTGRDLLHLARQLDALIEALDPMLDRIEQRAASRELGELESRLISVERWIAEFEREQRAAPQLREIKRQEGR